MTILRVLCLIGILITVPLVKEAVHGYTYKTDNREESDVGSLGAAQTTPTAETEKADNRDRADYNTNRGFDRLIPVGIFKVTAYTAGVESTGKNKNHPDYGLTASGKYVTEGTTVSSDWDVLPNGTMIFVEGVGYRTVEDRGGSIRGNRIDIYMTDVEDANNFGVQFKQVYIVK